MVKLLVLTMNGVTATRMCGGGLVWHKPCLQGPFVCAEPKGQACGSRTLYTRRTREHISTLHVITYLGLEVVS